jgi:hypothetical protein
LAPFIAPLNFGMTVRVPSGMQLQIGKLQEKADQLAGMIAYMQAKIAWLEKGSRGPQPQFEVSSPRAKRPKGR